MRRVRCVVNVFASVRSDCRGVARSSVVFALVERWICDSAHAAVNLEHDSKSSGFLCEVRSRGFPLLRSVVGFRVAHASLGQWGRRQKQ